MGFDAAPPVAESEGLEATRGSAVMVELPFDDFGIRRGDTLSTVLSDTRNVTQDTAYWHSVPFRCRPFCPTEDPPPGTSADADIAG